MPPRVIKSIDELRSLVGQEVGSSEWITVTQDMINRFADVTGDHQWIHVDIERSKRESPFKTTIAHGFLTLSLVVQLQATTMRVDAGQKMTINYGLNRVRFISPVPAEAKIHSRSSLKEVVDFPGGVQCTWTVTVEREGGEKPCLVAETVGRIYL